MNKWLSMVPLVLGLLAGQAAHAEQVKLTGEAKSKFQWINYSNSAPEEHTRRTTFLLNGNYQVNANTESFLRFGWREYRGDSTESNQSKLDQYGIRLKNGSTTWTLGVKDSYLGAFGGMLDLGDNVGRGLFSGMEMTIEEKQWQAMIQAGKLDGFLFHDKKDRAMYAVQAATKIGGVQVTGTVLDIEKMEQAGQFTDLSFTIQDGKATYLSEFVHSSGRRDPWAVFIGTHYRPDDEHTLVLVFGRTGETAIPQGRGTLGAYDSGLRGVQFQVFRRLGQGQLVATLSKARSFVYDMDITKTELEYKLEF